MTAVRVALPCGRLVSMCIACASVFARFLSKRIRDMAICVGQREDAAIYKDHLGTVLTGAPVCLPTSMTKDSVHSLPAMSALSPLRAKSGRLRVMEKRGGDTSGGDTSREDGAADAMPTEGELPSRPVPLRTLKGAGARAGGGGVPIMLSTLPTKQLRGFGSFAAGGAPRGEGAPRGYSSHSTRTSLSQFADIHSPSSVFVPLSPAAANQGKTQSLALSPHKMRSPAGDRDFVREETNMYMSAGK